MMKINTKYRTTDQLRAWQMLHLLLCLLAATGANAQWGADLGSPAMSTLTWDHISTVDSDYADHTIGLTKNNKMYVWGGNYVFTIHTNVASTGAPIVQTTPYYVPSPAGEKVIKVAAGHGRSTATGANVFNNFFGCLTESGKLYGWGLNLGYFPGIPSWPVLSNSTTYTGLAPDSTLSKRTPQQITILGESQFVDFAFGASYSNFWVAIGASGKAYTIGNAAALYDGTFAAIPIPAGADAATFKYVRVWTANGAVTEGHQVYLKGNDGNIYYTGLTQRVSVGVPSYYSDPATSTYPDAGGNPPPAIPNLRTDIPRLVPFPAGEDIVEMKITGGNTSIASAYYAISASGKAYASGFWGRVYTYPITGYTNKQYFTYPLAKLPTLNTELAKVPYGGDTLYILKRFCEIAMPPSASKIIDIYDNGVTASDAVNMGCVVITDEYKAYWAGRNANTLNALIFPNFLQFNDPYNTPRCDDTRPIATPSKTQWTVELINYRGAAKICAPPASGRMFIISKTGRGYFEGGIKAYSGLGKVVKSTTIFPIPIANEQLDVCNPNPGDAGAAVTSAPAVGTIDCSKTKLWPAPVAGTPSQTTLMVSVNVTTAGTFTPITVSGSGMSLGNGITSVSTTTTGVQAFYIPLNYDGSALANTFQFTVGSAGSCTADLTQKPNKQIANVWSLTNCSAITPGMLSK
ncbi:hypothetical protein [Runella salmonicolor]|uniref:Uncharacterized protein n=1 Tax=Runella salmonicolor TaxID=2950278 RepID=A0ABT1G0Q0_9BACT|nr:hypothetical protein [Runella salmonicolor]MCP1386538.1 hypothetical protein [Runella salmonicolor]